MKKSSLSKTFLLIIRIFVAFAIGFAIAVPTVMAAIYKGLGRQFNLLHFYAAMISGFVMQLILHEAGHYVFGKLSGYRFVSFRVLSFMLIRSNGKLRFCRYRLPGTAGQCLMAPNKPYDPNNKQQLYNYGGSLMNFLSALAAVPIYFYAHGIISVYAVAFALIGIVVAMMNAAPLKSMINNDGKNARVLKKSERARFAFFVQLSVYARAADGQRLKDMPDAWFIKPEVNDALTLNQAINRAERLMDQERYDEALDEYTALLPKARLLSTLSHFLIKNDMIYLHLTRDNTEAAKALMTKGFLSFSKSAASLLQVQRTRYACALAFRPENAAKEKEKLNAILNTTPFTGEKQSEEMYTKRAERLITRG